MKRLFGLIAASLLWALSASACSCSTTIIDFSYAVADAVFRGTADINANAGTQQRFIRFQVSDIFKGLPPGTTYVWVDPDSTHSSCHTTYRPGEEYLIFGTTNKTPLSTVKEMESSAPLSEEEVTANSRMVYRANECSASRDIHYPSFSRDLASLSRYAAGIPVAPIMGQVLSYPYNPWSEDGGPAGIEVLLDTGKGIWNTITDSEGKFFFDEGLGAGSYKILARYPGTYSVPSMLYVDSRPYSHVFVFLRPISKRREQ